MAKQEEIISLMRRMGMNVPTKESRIYENAYDNFLENEINLNEDKIDNDESEKVRQMILSNNYWERNKYISFLDSLNKSTRKPFLSNYTPQQLKEKHVQTYKLKGYNIGFALYKDEDDGLVDIISVHNNEPNIAHVGDALIEIAKKNGGNKLDHYDGFLSNLYAKHGFEEYDRYKWKDEFANKDWDYAKYGRPDVILRKLKKEE